MTSEDFTAEIPAKQLSLSISAKVVERLKQEVSSHPDLSGGLLLGHKNPADNNKSLVVADCFPVAASESEKGCAVNPKFLAQALALWRPRSRATLYAVGQYRVTFGSAQRNSSDVNIRDFASKDVYLKLNVQGTGTSATVYIIDDKSSLTDAPDLTLPFDLLMAGNAHGPAARSSQPHASSITERPDFRIFEWRDHRREWESRARAILNTHWLRVLLRKAEGAPRHSVPAATNPVVEPMPISSPPATSFVGLGTRSDLANRPPKSSTDATVMVSDARSAGAANISNNEQVKDANCPNFGDPSVLRRGLSHEDVPAGEHQPTTSPLFGKSKDGSGTIIEENASTRPASSATESPIPSLREPKLILPNKFRLLRVISAWAVVLMFAGMLGLTLLRHRTLNLSRSKREGADPATPLGFEPVRSGSAWELHWDVRMPALKSAKNGVLTITDGVQVRKLELDRSKLDTGWVRYVPEAQDVNFRLQVYTLNNRTLSESVRTLTGMSAGLQPNARERRVLVPRSVSDRNSLSNLDISRAAKPINNLNSRRSLVGHANAPTNPANPNYDHSTSPASALREANAERPSIASEPAVALALESAQDKQVAGHTGIPSNQDSIAQSASGNAQPAKPIQDQRTNAQPTSVVANPPVAPKPITPGTTLHGQPGEASYVGPQPLRKPIPNLTSFGTTLSSVREVQVEVYIDASGRVTNARFANAVSDPNSILNSAAISAARQWTFEPARSHGRAIHSVYKVIFRFTPST
ncbi:MAG: TonB family protein [Acidobacteriota bacterium]|nr:TonB family protein [Acidobacteriota bacterium]